MSNISKTGYRRRKELSLDGLHSAVDIFMALNTQSICKCVTTEILFGTVPYLSVNSFIVRDCSRSFISSKRPIKLYTLAA